MGRICAVAQHWGDYLVSRQGRPLPDERRTRRTRRIGSWLGGLAIHAALSIPVASAQSAPPAKAPSGPAEPLPGGRMGPQGVPQALRWTENWAKPPADDAPLLERIRHIPLGDRDDVYLSLGGQIRLYYTDWRHATLGLRPRDNNDPLQHRLRLLADLHVGPNLRAYVELGDTREHASQYVTATNRNEIDVYQAFIDVTLPLGDAGRVTLRPGRFEMPLGNGKLVGMREAPGMRFTYQGVRGTYILPGKLSVDAFAVKPVNIKPGAFDDGPSHVADFHGVYVSAPGLLGGIGADIYWYEFTRDRATLRAGTGRDERNNWGGRLWSRDPHWDLDLEATYQSGRFAGRDIQAYALLFEGGYTATPSGMQPRLGLRADLFSGDKDPARGASATFVAAAPRLTMTSEAGYFNFSNLMDLYPSVTLKPRKDVSVMAGPDFLWRNRKADGVYIGPSGASFAPYGPTRFIGTALNLEATWQATRRLQFRLFETRFLAGNKFKAGGGRDANYLGLLSDYRF
jgi:hypothetical protein